MTFTCHDQHEPFFAFTYTCVYDSLIGALVLDSLPHVCLVYLQPFLCHYGDALASVVLALDSRQDIEKVHLIGPFHIRKRMCVIYEFAIIEFDVTFGFHRGSQKSSKCIGVNGGTPYF